MIQLPNNCRIGKIGVSPKNWQSPKANPAEDWMIFYRFYDDNLNQEKFVRIKNGLNRFDTLKEKQEFVKNALQVINDELLNGFNPIAQIAPAVESVQKSVQIITLRAALESAFDKMVVVHNTRTDINSMLNYVYPALERLGFDTLPIQEITRKHIKLLFEDLAKNKKTWSANLFNHYRKYLHKLFADIIDDELLENNPVTHIKKQKSVHNQRKELTLEERRLIDKHLYKNYPAFWRFTNIFFHSGSRITEMLALRKSDIDLEKHQFTVLIKKGKEHRREPRTIKDIVFNEWQHIYELASGNQYIFSRSLLPGNVQIRREQITRRWEEHVKKKLHIEADFYSMKHSNLDETSELAGIIMAQKAAGHASPVITMKYYNKGQKKREHELLRKVNNKFA
jgi:integrase